MRLKIKDLLKLKPENQEVAFYGWVRTRRDSKGGFSFIEMNDGSCLKNIQVVCPSSLGNYENEVLKISAGYSIRIKGTLVKSPAAGQEVEVNASEVIMLGEAEADYPLQKKRHSFEFLREIAHLRPRSKTFGAITRVRSALAFAIHSFFQERGFFYVNTPLITTSDCEGAGEMFKITTLDLANLPKNTDGAPDHTKDFFGCPSFLTVSGQLEGEAYACAMGDIYTFGPTFRAENSNTPRHLAEFWMVEPEMAFCDLNGDIKIAVEFIKYLITYILQNQNEDMEFFDKFISPGIIALLANVAEKDFRIVEYTEGIDILLKSGETFEYPVEWGLNLQAEHERYLTEQHFNSPIVLINFPSCIKPFYMYVNEGGKTVRGMDILVPNIGEIIGGSQREHRLDILISRMNEINMNQDNYRWFTDLRRYGSVPHAGFGLGFERMMLFITGMKNIRDVIAFPRTPGNARF